MDPVELVKNPFDVLLRDTLALINDLKLYAATDLFSPDADCRAGWRIFRRIEQYVSGRRRSLLSPTTPSTSTALLHQAALWARGERLSTTPRPGDGTVDPPVGEAWRRVSSRRPAWRAEAVVRVTSETGLWDEAVLAPLGPRDKPGTVRDLAIVDARRARSGVDPRLAIEQRDGSPGPRRGGGAGPSAEVRAGGAAIPTGGLRARRSAGQSRSRSVRCGRTSNGSMRIVW